MGGDRASSINIINQLPRLLPGLSAIFFVWILSIIPLNSHAQTDSEYYEISVNLDIQRVGGTEVDAVIQGKEIYLAINHLFDFLKVKNTLSENNETVSGFYISPANKYLIDRSRNTIEIGNKIIDIIPGDLLMTESNLYLKSDYFESAFGLNCIFNFRTLSVRVETDLELPLIREMRQEEIRKNLNRIKGDLEADTTIERRYPMFKFGMADWSAIATEEVNGINDTRLNLSLGSMIAGGEASASITYDSRTPFSEKQQYYLWRYVNNDQRLLRQVKAGKIFTNSLSTIYNPVVGVQLTNTPTTFRRSYGTYKISERTEPGWTVELYVNNVLVDYVTADASGFYSFDVPLIYGNTIVKLKFFGPWGEERTQEKNINIPFNFLPPKKMEYTLSAGFVEDSDFSKFGRANVSYGLSNRITIGAGIEYLSAISANPVMPYVNSSIRITNNLLISGEFVPGIKTGGAITFRLPSNLQLDVKYNLYDENQEAINYNYLEERKIQLSLPVKIGKLSAYNRFSVNQLVLPLSKYTTGEWLFSGSILGINTNLTTYALFIDKTDPYIYSNLSMAIRLPARIIAMPQLQYGYTQKQLLSARLRIEKHLLDRAFLNVSYEKDFRSKMNMAEVGFRYNFSFAQTGVTARRSNNKNTFVQYARGSLIADKSNRYYRAEDKNNVGKGGIIIKPFLDYNSNGRRDPGEEGAPGLNIRANGGRVDKSEKDTIIAILGLEPYTSCFIELDPNSFYNIAWRLPFNTMSVKIDPNVMKSIEIPVAIVGEASGFVRIDRDGEINGLGRIIVNFYNEDQKLVSRTLSEADGYFSNFGLTPGSYYVMPDTAQLVRLGMISDPDSIRFNVDMIIDGDLISGLDFALRMLPPDSIGADTIIPRQPVTRRDTTYMIIHEVVEELMTITEDSWAIQLGAFTVKSNAERLKRRLEGMLGKDAEIVIEGGFHKVRILEIKDREEVDRHLAVLNKNGFSEFWVIRLKAMQQQLVMREVSDTLTSIIETVIDPAAPESIAKMSIKIGAFRNEALAEAILRKLSITIDKKFSIIEEDGFYRIMASDFKTVEELDRAIVSLGMRGIRDMEVAPEPVIVPEVLTDTLPSIEQIHEVTERIVVDSLNILKAEYTKKDIETDLAKETLKMEEPKVSLLVGSFPRRTQALKAKRIIESRLNLQVEIVEQWDLYRVFVRGFFTKEETYKYYPELAGLGYDVISIIDNSGK